MTANAKAGGVVQGGSSISQQLAKNLFLSNERTLERKVKEAFLALWLETRLPKNEILKLYLDRAYLGGGTFGVDAAAQYYFNKSARDVNLAEAAMLAGLFKAPSKFAPHINLPAARARANVVLDNLVEAGFMTEGQVFGARRNPATPVDRRDERAPNYYLDWAFDEMKKLVADIPKIGARAGVRGPLGARYDLQKHTEQALENSLRQYGREYHAKQGATVLDGDRRCGARDGRRARLRGKPVQSRHRRAAPTRLLVQAIRLFDRADERLQAHLDRCRFPGLHRQLVPEKLRRRPCRRDDADRRLLCARSTSFRSSCRSRSATGIRRSAARRSGRRRVRRGCARPSRYAIDAHRRR